MPPPKFPRPPRKLCDSWGDWLLGNMSFSKYHEWFYKIMILPNGLEDNPKRIVRYIKRVYAWCDMLGRWGIETRRMTRLQWKRYNRFVRIRRLLKCEQHIDPG